MTTKPKSGKNSLAHRWGLKPPTEDNKANAVKAEDPGTVKRKQAAMKFGADPEQVQISEAGKSTKKSESRNKLERTFGIKLDDPEGRAARKRNAISQAYGVAKRQ